MLSFREFTNELLIIESIRYMDNNIFKPIIEGKYNIIAEDTKFNYLSNDEEVELIKTYQADPNSEEGHQALNKLVENKMGFIYSKVGDFIRSHFNYSDKRDDLIQEASLALIKAIENFKVDSGVIFTSYAAKCINGAILNTINTNRYKSIDNFKGDTGSLVSIDDKVKGSNGAGDDKDMSISDLLPDDENPVSEFEKSEKRTILNDWIKQLPKIEQIALMMYYLPEDGNKGATFEEIGKKIGMSTMGAKKLVDRVVLKLKKTAREQGWL